MGLAEEHDLLQGDGLMAIEPISFDKGLNNARSPLILEDGELVTASGMSYDTDGSVTPRESRQKVNTTAYGAIRALRRDNTNHVLMVEGTNVRWKWDLDGYCDQYTAASEDFTLVGTLTNTARPRMADYEDMTFIATPIDRKVFIAGNWYEWDVPAPTTAPTGAAGASGNPSGTYSLYYTYLVYFPNGRAVETAPSPAGSVTVSSQQISWSKIGICPYSVTGGSIYRKIYRYSTTLATTYYVATIADNTTTTYTDNYADATIAVNDAIDTENYVSPPTGMTDLCDYLGRIWAISGNYLYPSEPYLPFNFDSTESIQVTNDGDDLTALIPWADQLYISTKSTFYRLQGTTSATWGIRRTFASHGCINKHTLQRTRYGLVFLWHDGLYIFDGSLTKKITGDRLADSLFTSTISSKAACYSEWDRDKYYFHYPESGTTISKRLVCDFSTYPAIRFYYDDFVPTAHSFHAMTGIDYYGFGGYHYADGGTDAPALSIRTGDRAAKEIIKQKELEYLYYDIDTGGKNVTACVYVDDTLAYTVVLNTSARERGRKLLPKTQGYRFYLTLTSPDARGATIYAPWAISTNSTGV
jgi:hypothetical protein